MHVSDPGHYDLPPDPWDPAERVKTLENRLAETGLIDRAALAALIDTYASKIGPRNGEKVVARAWVDKSHELTSDSNTGPAHARMPRDDTGPVFAEAWNAHAFALAIKLSQLGHFTPREWAAALARELKAAADRGEPDDAERYYLHFLAALEKLMAAKGL